MPLSPLPDLTARNDAAAWRLLAQVDLDPYSPTRGCYDRRYWGWRLVDFPEATYQRAVKPLAMLFTDTKSALYRDGRVLDAILAGIEFTVRVQHKNGSFDQAFPNEQSFGATAFLLHSVAGAGALLREAGELNGAADVTLERCIRRAGAFLCRHDERHGRITNHVAGAVAGLLEAHALLGEPHFAARARLLLKGILASQDADGWFPEYDGADPGYQSLCIHFLADAHRLAPELDLAAALEQAVEFIAHFAHPDGSFGGEYGARRTGVFHPGGVARLSGSLPAAASLLAAIRHGLVEGRTPGPDEMDTGNLAPVLETHVLGVQVGRPRRDAWPLPCERVPYARDFPGTGLCVRGTEGFYAVVGVQAGGVVKAYSRSPGRCILDDGGFLARINGKDYSTQATGRARLVESGQKRLVLEAPFLPVPRALPTPFRFLLLRLLNLTLMRSIGLGNVVKRLLVKLLIRGGRRSPLTLVRSLRLEPFELHLADVVRGKPRLRLQALSFGAPFRGLHMASAGYHARAEEVRSPRGVDVSRFEEGGELRIHTTVAVSREPFRA